MTPPVSGSGPRVLIDPDDLRDVSTRMRGAAVILSSAGRELAARPLPQMPPNLVGLVGDVMCRVNGELQDLAIELVNEAGTLAARATWAELGGGDAVSWLIPGLHHFSTNPGAPSGPTQPLPRVTEEEILRSEEWAVELLDGMHDSMQKVDDQIDRLGSQADEVFGKEVVAFVDEYADEIPVKALGKVTLLAGAALDVYQHWDEGPAEAVARAGISAAGGALGTGLCMLLLSPTGPGIVGCVVGGGILGGLGGDYVGDEVFEDG